MKCWILFALLLFPAVALSQNSDAIDLEAFIEERFGIPEEDLNYADLYESLFQFYRSPLNLNTAQAEDLMALNILTDHQIQGILTHREKYGRLLSIYELQAIAALDMPTIRRLLPFVRVSDDGFQRDSRSLWQRIAAEKQRFLLLRYRQPLQQKAGFQLPADDERAFLGSPGQLYARFRVNHPQDFSFGFTMEKDEGERLGIGNGQSPADFFSFHAAVMNQGKLKSLIVGDYQIQSGQGLLLSGGFQLGKGAETITTVRRHNLGPLPYTSVMESGFFRGVAAKYALTKHWEATAFTSYNRLSGNLSEGEVPAFSSIYANGLHRSRREVARKNVIAQWVNGAQLRYSGQRFALGTTVLSTLFSGAYQRTPRVYNQQEFNGRRNFNWGFDYRFSVANASFFGEGALSASGGKAFVGGMLMGLTSQIDFASLFRHYATDFHSFHGAAFGERSRNINETGFYNGLKFRHGKRWTVAAYADLFRFRWLQYLVDAPSAGQEYLIRATYRPNKKLRVFAQYRYESKPRNIPQNDTPTDEPMVGIRQNFWLHLQHQPTEKMQFRSRVQWAYYQQQAQSNGIAIMQDLIYDFGRITLSGRLAFFDTDWETRQYAFERDVLYAFSIPAYHGIGRRSYLLAKVTLTESLDFWARYAVTRFQDRNQIGSSVDSIEGAVRSDLKVQLRLKL